MEVKGVPPSRPMRGGMLLLLLSCLLRAVAAPPFLRRRGWAAAAVLAAGLVGVSLQLVRSAKREEAAMGVVGAGAWRRTIPAALHAIRRGGAEQKGGGWALQRLRRWNGGQGQDAALSTVNVVGTSQSGGGRRGRRPCSMPVWHGRAEEARGGASLDAVRQGQAKAGGGCYPCFGGAEEGWGMAVHGAGCHPWPWWCGDDGGGWKRCLSSQRHSTLRSGTGGVLNAAEQRRTGKGQTTSHEARRC